MAAVAAITFTDKFLSNQEGSASRNFFLSALFWSLLGMGAGLLGGIEFSNPDLVHNIPQLAFPHVRMFHVNAVAIGWLSMGYVGSIFHMVPTLCKTKLWSERLGNFTMWAWNVVMIGAFCTLLNGNTEGREYAELGAVLDVMVMLALILVAWNTYMTVLNRRVKKLYVSLWYFMGSLFWFPLVYIIGQRTFVALPGLNDAIVGWFYGHNILGMWFTTVGVGMMYYLLPRLTGAPLYSHGLSMLGFWGIALFYAPTGTHHILQSPVPEWLKAIAIISSAFLLVPVLTVLTNFFMTMKGKWTMMITDMPLRFAVTSCMFYLVTCIQGPFQATRWINWYLHFSQWVVGHAHLALLGTFSFILTSSFYYSMPRLTGRQWHSQGLIRAHYWLKFLGFLLMMASLTIAGLIQSAGWAFGVPIDQWSMQIRPYWFFRMISGIMILLGQCLFAYNTYKTLYTPAAVPAEGALKPRGGQSLMYGYRLGAIGIVCTFFAIIFSTVLMPMVLFNPAPSGHGNDYNLAQTGDALRGRQIYVREGCFYCHTQFNRLQDRGYGPLVMAGDFVFETPHQLGTARNGPDLTNEGGRFPYQWQKAHLVNPRAVKPGSIMPSFSYLNDRDMNDLVTFIESMGNKRESKAFVEAPDEYRTTTETGRKLLALKTVDTNADASANAGRGIYQQNCASCHGLDGRGEGPNAISLEKKPPNLTRPFYKQYPDEFWFYRITEGVPGTRMPRWGDGGSLTDPRGGILTQEQRWYLVAYLKTLQKDKEETVDNINQLDKVEPTRLPVLTHQDYEPSTGE